MLRDAEELLKCISRYMCWLKVLLLQQPLCAVVLRKSDPLQLHVTLSVQFKENFKPEILPVFPQMVKCKTLTCSPDLDKNGAVKF